ncbi:MAG: CDP-alcohol phosphatidyltransferase family protein [Actinoplanes sp.]
MHRYPLAEVQRRTYRSLDSWWTVLLVDPHASRLVRLVAPYRWVTPNRLTMLAGLIGVGAAACFVQGGRWWLAGGALLFHLAFVVDCMDGKLARLNGAGTLLGAWFDFMGDRLRVILCAAALMGGQYRRTGEARYLWLVALVIALDLLRYLNAGQMGRIRAAIRQQHPAVPNGAGVAAAIHAAMRAKRIRLQVVSGVEFEMAVFIVAPLSGYLAGVTLAAGALLTLVEVRLIVVLVGSVRRHSESIAAFADLHRFDQQAAVARQGAG